MRVLLSGQWQLSLLNRRQRERIEDQFLTLLVESRERQFAAQLFGQSSLRLLLTELSEAKPAMLREKIHDKDSLVRLLVIQTIARRQVHLEDAVLECLTDPHPVVAATAHRALIRLARGTDFGPTPKASHTGIARSIEK